MQKSSYNAPQLPKSGKRVRFVSDSGPSDDDAGFFSPVSPPDPPVSFQTTSESPSLSTPSLSPPSPGFDTVLPQVSPASSDAPLTPSPARAQIELPQIKDSVAPSPSYPTPNAILAAGATPKLKWDISLPPGNASMNSSALSSVALEYSATLSHSETLTLMVSPLPGMAISVLPSLNQPYVCVMDVLSTVYRFFRQPLSNAELLQFNPSWREAIEKAYRARYKKFSNHPKVYEEEKGKGLKKIDLLLGRTQWLGIRPAAEDGLWDLYLS